MIWLGRRAAEAEARQDENHIRAQFYDSYGCMYIRRTNNWRHVVYCYYIRFSFNFCINVIFGEK